jgi:hypothetical protein
MGVNVASVAGMHSKLYVASMSGGGGGCVPNRRQGKAVISGCYIRNLIDLIAADVLDAVHPVMTDCVQSLELELDLQLHVHTNHVRGKIHIF